jgi:hypothetical protein
MYTNNLNSFYGVVKALAQCSAHDDDELQFWHKRFCAKTNEYVWKVGMDSSSDGVFTMVGEKEDKIFFPDYCVLAGKWFERTDITLERKLSHQPTQWLSMEAGYIYDFMDVLLDGVIRGKLGAEDTETILKDFLGNPSKVAGYEWVSSFNGDWLSLLEKFEGGVELTETGEKCDVTDMIGTPSYFYFESPTALIRQETELPEIGQYRYRINNGCDRSQIICLDTGTELYKHSLIVLLRGLNKIGRNITAPEAVTFKSDQNEDGILHEYRIVVLPKWATTRRA